MSFEREWPGQAWTSKLFFHVVLIRHILFSRKLQDARRVGGCLSLGSELHAAFLAKLDANSVCAKTRDPVVVLVPRKPISQV